MAQTEEKIQELFEVINSDVKELYYLNTVRVTDVRVDGEKVKVRWYYKYQGETETVVTEIGSFKEWRLLNKKIDTLDDRIVQVDNAVYKLELYLSSIGLK